VSLGKEGGSNSTENRELSTNLWEWEEIADHRFNDSALATFKWRLLKSLRKDE